MKNETQNEIHFIGKVAQKAVIERDGRVLVIRDPRVEGIIWELPGGRLNEGEDPKAGLAREIKEELGVDCVVNQVVYMTQFLQGNEGKNGLMIAYKATIPVDANFILSIEEICDFRWIDSVEADTLIFYPEYKETLNIYFEKH